jgi:hypothetical protein
MTPTKDQNLMIKKENNFTATKFIVEFKDPYFQHLVVTKTEFS